MLEYMRGALGQNFSALAEMSRGRSIALAGVLLVRI